MQFCRARWLLGSPHWFLIPCWSSYYFLLSSLVGLSRSKEGAREDRDLHLIFSHFSESCWMCTQVFWVVLFKVSKHAEITPTISSVILIDWVPISTLKKKTLLSENSYCWVMTQLLQLFWFCFKNQVNLISQQSPAFHKNKLAHIEPKTRTTMNNH